MAEEKHRTTWDGLPITNEKVMGATVVVYRSVNGEIKFLILHRTHCDAYGDWSWTPPSGARMPGESIESGALRELREEAGLSLEILPTELGTDYWRVYYAQADTGDEVVLIDQEHDDFRWVLIDEAEELCKPSVVYSQIRGVLDLIAAPP